ncbi:MAG TPA: flippase [Desulfomonilaceae bacterium]|nr:flippase [Desulfomonilaceae bacterium]
MGSRLSLFKNTFALAVPNVLNPFISFVLILMISRSLGVDGLGEYSLVLAYVGIFSTFASLGLGDLVVRELARNPEDVHTFFVNAGVFGAISSLASMIIMDACVLAMGYGQEVVKATVIMSFSLVASTAMTYLEAIFRSVEKSKYIALTYLAENALRVGACVLLLLNGYGIIALFFAVLVSRILALLMLFSFYRKLLGMPGWRFKPEIWRTLWKEAPTFTSIAIFSTIHLSLDQIMLSKLQTIESVGIYSAADRLLSICKTVPVAFASALLPFFSQRMATGFQGLRRITEDSLRYLSLVLFPVVVGTVVLGDSIITMMYGATFVAAGPVLRLHIVSLIPFSAVFVLAQVLIATDNQRTDLKINMVAALVNFVLNFVLIPPYGAMGAAVATLLSILVFHTLQYLYIKSYLFRLSFFGITHRALFGSLAMGAFTYAFRDWNLFLNVGVSAALYFFFAIALGAISRDDLATLTGWIKRTSGTKEA